MPLLSSQTNSQWVKTRVGRLATPAKPVERKAALILMGVLGKRSVATVLTGLRRTQVHGAAHTITLRLEALPTSVSAQHNG